MNIVFCLLKSTPSLGLWFPKLDLNSLYIVVYSDASYNSTPEHKSQLGYVISLLDSNHRCNTLQSTFYKSCRVIRSSLASETIAFVDAFDISLILEHDLQSILGKPILLLMMIDSKLLLDVITGNGYTTESRLIVDIAAVREAYNQRIISNIALIDREYNPADSFTKIVHAPLLEKIMKNGYLYHPINQYILDSFLILE